MPRLKPELINKILDYIIGIVAGLAFLLLLVRWGLKFDEGTARILEKIDIAILFIFTGEVLTRFLAAPVKKGYLRRHWIDLIVLIPFIQFIRGVRTAGFFVILRQIIILFVLFSRTKRLQKLISLLGLKPAQMLTVSFLMTIFIGAFLLTLPAAGRSGRGLDLTDALFTATSATCVTGLSVKDTGTFFSLFGQLVILALIQIGALGIMTFSVTLFLAAGRQVSQREKMTMQEVLDQDSIADITGLLKFIVKMTFSAELLGAVFLYFAFMPYISDPVYRIYAAVFHSVSAFCNAGFSLFPDSLMRFVRDVPVNLIICGLIIFGGTGFIVVKDIWQTYVRRKAEKKTGLKLHTKIVLAATAMLLVLGTVLFLLAENNTALRGMPFKEKFLVCFFQSATARTAGFNTLDTGTLANAGIVTLLVLMFIGASPGSTGGGIKTTTFWIILKGFTGHFKSRDDISSFRRRLPPAIAGKAWAVFILCAGLVLVFTYALCLCEPFSLRDVLFETVSAFGTAGLSCGITPQLSVNGKLLVTLLMFLGRLGPLTIVLAFARYKRKIYYTYAEERVMVG